MMRQEPGMLGRRGLLVDMAGGPLFERGRDRRMKLLASSTKQTAAGSVLNEGVFEDI
jgi:hypothetical protein